MFIKESVEFLYDRHLLGWNKENLANYLTLAGAWLCRLYLYIFFFVLLIVLRDGTWLFGWRYAAIVIAGLASLCDLFDGYIARKYKIETEFGKIYDPHHDKTQYLCKSLALIIDAVCAYWQYDEYGYLFWACLLAYFTLERDETVGFHRLWAATVDHQLKLGARSSGKWRTRICFSGFFVLHLLIYPFTVPWAFVLVAFFMIVVTLVSLHDYVRSYRRAIKKFRKQR